MHLWAGMNIKDAIDTPRLHHQLLPMQVTYFPGFQPEVVDYLKEIGHKVVPLPKTTRGSVAQGVAVEATGVVTANYDWRKSGSVDGY